MKLFRVSALLLAVLVWGSSGIADDAEVLSSDAKQQQQKSSRLNGLWISNCYQFEEGVYQVRTFEFVLDHLATITTMSYFDSRCSQPPVDSQVVSATWDMGRAIVTEEGLVAHTLDVLLRADVKQELTTVKQIVHFQDDSFFLGINKKLDSYPNRLDWDISFTLVY